MSDSLDLFFEDMISLLGETHVCRDREKIAGLLSNTLGIQRDVYGCLYPSMLEEVRDIVRKANQHKIPLYPFSRGQNFGYGGCVPPVNGVMLVSLERMNAIREFNERHGYVIIEPGVSQKQLYDFLIEKNAPFWMDTTGAGLESSIIGNTLEGGFGHTPKGNRRAHFTDVEMVLGNGQIFKTGAFPGLGPDLSGMAVQSNFGIVTAMRISLVPKPDRFESFVVSVDKDQNLEKVIDILNVLALQGVLLNLSHVVNALRSFMILNPCPAEFKDQLMNNDQAAKLLQTPIVKAGRWSVMGGLYGSRLELTAQKKLIRTAFQGIGHVEFFDDARIDQLQNICRSPFKRFSASFKKLSGHLAAYKELHGMMEGVPTDHMTRRMGWRVEKTEDIGLIWFAPTLPAEGQKVRRMIDLASEKFDRYQFEMPVTITQIRPGQVVGIFSIHFNRRNEADVRKAHELYEELKNGFRREGIELYRSSVLNMAQLTYGDAGKKRVLKTLKRALDPHDIIAPGRYGITSALEEDEILK